MRLNVFEQAESHFQEMLSLCKNANDQSDVSNHQGKINWAEIPKSEISFVYTKTSEGGDFIEPVPKVT
ncbi:GH25 family lysozyme [Leptospira sp. Fiocruz LV4135]|uniref:GH25 family lysozyme n=1 Tax=Leptospira sp. Fiocruz LV4135 TaxID=1193013 RepID=UPI0002BDA2CD|nr:GH25 family lysozyme [Leptospira sp. Fiocruz LV4135]EMI61590.1 glycosyl hydrolase family 25 domain protein [Leptospira sp. Fiocruz LV4135]